MNDDSKIDVESDSYFAMIPEWVMYSGVSKSAIMVYLVLNRYANKKSWQCFPSRETIIEKAQISKNTLDKCLKELMDIGALKVEKRRTGHGVYASNLYTVCMLPPNISHTPKIGITHTPKIGTTHTPKSNPLTIVNNQSQRTRDISSSSDDDGLFDRWWEVYPRKKGKGQARTAFKKALRKTDFETLLLKAEQYSEERFGQNPDYTAYPATWLNGEYWLNEKDTTFISKPATFREREIDLVKQAMQRIKEAPHELR